MTARHSGRHRRRRSPAAAARTALLPVGVASAATLAAAPLAAAAPVAGDDTPPCDDSADICVDLSERRAWLTEDGRATDEAMRINVGTADDPTPTGTFTVQRKERHHVSREIDGAPMPYSVFFDGDGRAFHSGDTSRPSHGCVRLEADDARAVFAALEPGDEVEIVR